MPSRVLRSVTIHREPLESRNQRLDIEIEAITVAGNPATVRIVVGTDKTPMNGSLETAANPRAAAKRGAFCAVSWRSTTSNNVLRCPA